MEDKKKFELEQQQNVPLSMYLFTVTPGNIQITVPLEVRAILAYNDTDAINMIRRDYPASMQIAIIKKGQIPIKGFLDVLKLQQDAPVPVTTQVPATEGVNATELKQEPTPQMKKKEFINNCMLIADSFVLDKEDQASLKEILGKIKLESETLNEPPTKAPEPEKGTEEKTSS